LVSAPPHVSSGMMNHVQLIIDGLSAELTPEQRERAIGLIHANADVVSTRDYHVGRTDLIDCKINTEDILLRNHY
jgi:hypothetical protein